MKYNAINNIDSTLSPEIVGTDSTSTTQQYEVERLVNTLAAIIQKYAGQLDDDQPIRKAG